MARVFLPAKTTKRCPTCINILPASCMHVHICTVFFLEITEVSLYVIQYHYISQLNHNPGPGRVSAIPPNVGFSSIIEMSLALIASLVFVRLFVDEIARGSKPRSIVGLSTKFRGVRREPVFLQRLPVVDHAIESVFMREWGGEEGKKME